MVHECYSCGKEMYELDKNNNTYLICPKCNPLASTKFDQKSLYVLCGVCKESIPMDCDRDYKCTGCDAYCCQSCVSFDKEDDVSDDDTDEDYVICENCKKL